MIKQLATAAFCIAASAFAANAQDICGNKQVNEQLEELEKRSRLLYRFGEYIYFDSEEIQRVGDTALCRRHAATSVGWRISHDFTAVVRGNKTGVRLEPNTAKWRFEKFEEADDYEDENVLHAEFGVCGQDWVIDRRRSLLKEQEDFSTLDWSQARAGDMRVESSIAGTMCFSTYYFPDVDAHVEYGVVVAKLNTGKMRVTLYPGPRAYHHGVPTYCISCSIKKEQRIEPDIISSIPNKEIDIARLPTSCSDGAVSTALRADINMRMRFILAQAPKGKIDFKTLRKSANTLWCEAVLTYDTMTETVPFTTHLTDNGRLYVQVYR